MEGLVAAIVKLAVRFVGDRGAAATKLWSKVGVDAVGRCGGTALERAEAMLASPEDFLAGAATLPPTDRSPERLVDVGRAERRRRVASAGLDRVPSSGGAR